MSNHKQSGYHKEYPDGSQTDIRTVARLKSRTKWSLKETRSSKTNSKMKMIPRLFFLGLALGAPNFFNKTKLFSKLLGTVSQLKEMREYLI